MKKLILLSVIVLDIVISLSAQEIPFVFDKNRIDVGMMYVYEFSKNKEEPEFEPEELECFYLKTFNDIETMWMPLKGTKATYLEKYKMNWDYMMFEKREILNLMNKDELQEVKGAKTLKATINIDFSKCIERENVKNIEKGEIKEWDTIHRFKSIPTYFYRRTDLAPLWFVLRFYPFEKEKVSVNHYMSGYNNKFDIKYVGKEEVEVPYGKVLCHKFELAHQMSFAMKMLFKPKKAWIWLTSEDDRRYMVKYRNNNVRSTLYRNMEYRLAEIKKMTPEEWEEFKEKHGAGIKESQQ